MNYQEKRLSKTKEITVFCFLFLTFIGGNLEFAPKLFGYKKARVQLVKYRYKYFEEWYYQEVWGEWLFKWELMEFIDG